MGYFLIPLRTVHHSAFACCFGRRVLRADSLICCVPELSALSQAPLCPIQLTTNRAPVCVLSFLVSLPAWHRFSFLCLLVPRRSDRGACFAPL